MVETNIHNSTYSTDLSTGGTASNSIASPPISETKLQTAQLTKDVGGSRSAAKVLHEDLNELHQKTHDVEWRTNTTVRAKNSVPDMLGEISDLGFAWRDVARLIGVSVPAIQKWRRGEKASGTNRLKLAAFLAACDIIENHYMVRDIASWFEMPLSPHAPITAIDLYANESPDLVFEFASQHVDPESLLNQFDPEWRERYRSEFEVFEAGDGHRSIRMKA